jgi:hypothetical protein
MLMNAGKLLVCRPLATALLLAGSVGFTAAAQAQYAQDLSKPSITPPASNVPPTRANDATGAGKTDASANAPTSGDADVPKATLKDAMSEKPIIPSKAEMPDSAFKKLDPTGKGYVSKEDTKELNGFDKAFEQADANKDGKLSEGEFDKAWASFTGRSGN